MIPLHIARTLITYEKAKGYFEDFQANRISMDFLKRKGWKGRENSQNRKSMRIMSGTAILILLLVLFLLVSAFGFWCHFCYGESGGRSLTLMDAGAGATAPAIHIVKRKKCRCSDSFKGLCSNCEGPDFVGADGGFRELADFSDFGGDKGLGESDGDPIRGLLNNSSGNTHNHNHGQETTVDLNMDRIVYISNDYY